MTETTTRDYNEKIAGRSAVADMVKSTIMNVPLFPLGSVVLPGGRIPLQLFEPRYTDMLSRCIREDRGFVVVLLREGLETRRKVAFYDIGTYVRIVDFRQLDNGLLGITVEGESKVTVVRSWQQQDGLNVGDVECLLDEPRAAVPEAFSGLVQVLRALVRHPVVKELDMDLDFEDARVVGWRLTELLPLERHHKQALLEIQEPIERLRRLETLLDELEQR